MIPDNYTREKIVLEHRHTLEREAKHERMLADLPVAPSYSIQHFAGRLGQFLIALGTRLQQTKPHRKLVVYETSSKVQKP